jgi:hypothetical protein
MVCKEQEGLIQDIGFYKVIGFVDFFKFTKPICLINKYLNLIAWQN